MSPLERSIRAEIERDGPMPVAAFMEAANNDPDHGYYRGRDPLGRQGDFITAPEISQVFGELIGAWCAVFWQAMGAPDRVILAELGPGRGTLMADALRASAMLPAFATALEPHLVETSPTLTRLQQASLRNVAATWHADFEALPEGPLILIANEFFDALPVEQFVRRHDGWHRRCVGIDRANDGLCFTDGPRHAMTECPPDGDIWESSPAGRAIATAIADRLVRFGGAALVIDYGHPRSAAGETLQAVRRHRPVAVLDDPGEADLTAHVDFQALARAARAAGATVHGPVSQGEFLRRLGIETRMQKLLASATPDQQADIRSGCRRLVDPGQMGVMFKAMALTAPGAPIPAGFEIQENERPQC